VNSIHSIYILHTNDIHSHFEQMPPLAHQIRLLRERYGKDRTLVLDIGDHMDRMRLETEGTDGRANIAVMNATGYDAACLGNNEGLTLCPDTLEATFQQAEFAILTANMKRIDTGKLPEWIEPYRIFERNGVRIGCIGLTINFEEFYRLLNWDVRPPVEILQEYVPMVRKQADVVVLLSHLGIRYDEKIAGEVEGIDLILGGHTHHLLDRPMRIRNTWIAGAGKYGQYLGQIQIDWNSDLHRIEYIEGKVISMDGVPMAPDVSDILDQAGREGREVLTKPVTELTEPLPISWKDESRLGNLLADGLRQWVGAEIALFNSGQLLDGLDAGGVHRGRLHEICPSPINPCLLQLNGSQLRKTLEQSLLEEYQEKTIRGFGFRGKVLGTLCVSGITILYEPTGRPYEKIRDIRFQGQPLDPGRNYTIGTLDMFTFGVGYEEIQHGLGRRFFLPELLRDVLEQSLKNPKLIESSRSTRWEKQDSQPGFRVN
jgi:5'-nucleotidase